jgi:hypothetical protein
MIKSAIVTVFTLFACLLSYLNVGAATPETTLKTLLGSVNLIEQRAAFEKIVSSPKQYVPLVRDRLVLFAKGRIKLPMRSIDRLFYLAAFLKDKTIVPPIEALWRNTDILPYYCLYSCPIVFALTIYATYDLWTPPDNIKKVLDRHHDLYPEIRIASDISLDPTPKEHRAQGPGIDSLLKEASMKSEEELIELAGPKTKDWEKRFAAVCQLSYTVATSKNLKDLYWLAIQEPEPDGACEFRSSLYTAIYRAERAKRLGR